MYYNCTLIWYIDTCDEWGIRRASAEIHINGHFKETLIDKKIKIDTLHTIQMVAHLNIFSAETLNTFTHWGRMTQICVQIMAWRLDIFLVYWIEHVTFGLLYVMFTFPTRVFYRGIPGFAADCPCGVWCGGLTTCLLYVGPLFGSLV